MHLNRVTGVSPSGRIPFSRTRVDLVLATFSIFFLWDPPKVLWRNKTSLESAVLSQSSHLTLAGAALRRKSELSERALTKQRSVFPPLKNRGGNVGPRGRLISMNRGGQADVWQLLPRTRTLRHWHSRLGQFRSMHGSMLPFICSPIALFFALQLRDVQIHNVFVFQGIYVIIAGINQTNKYLNKTWD